jgi:uncharacterized Fe-S center protein
MSLFCTDSSSAVENCKHHAISQGVLVTSGKGNKQWNVPAVCRVRVVHEEMDLS